MQNFTPLSHGKTSDTYLSSDKTIVKKVYLTESIHCYYNELSVLKKLKGKEHFPQFIKADRYPKAIYMSYCGDRISADNLPSDWEKQLEEIFELLDSLNIIHDDFNWENFTVKDRILYQIDFGRTMDKKRYNFLRNYYYNKKKILLGM